MMEEHEHQQQQPTTVLLPHLSASGAWHSLKSMTWLCDDYLDIALQHQQSSTSTTASTDNEVSLDLNGSGGSENNDTAANALRKRSEHVLENRLIKDVQLKRAHRGWRLKAQVYLIDRTTAETAMYDEEGGAIVTGSWHTCTMVVERADPKTCACDCHNAVEDSETPFCEHIVALLMIANMIRSYAMPYTSATAAFWQKLEGLRVWLFTPMVESTPTTAAAAAAVVAAMPVMRRPRGRPPKSAIHPNHPTRSAAPPLSSSFAVMQQQRIVPISQQYATSQQEDDDEETVLSQQEEEVILELSTARHATAPTEDGDDGQVVDEEAYDNSSKRRSTASLPLSRTAIRTIQSPPPAPSHRMRQPPPQMSNTNRRRPAVSNTLKYARITKRAIFNLANDRLNRDFGEWMMKNLPADAISDFIQRCRSRFANQIVDLLTDEDMRHIETLLSDGMTRAEFKTEVMAYRDMLKQPKRESTIQKHEALLAAKNQQKKNDSGSNRRAVPSSSSSRSSKGKASSSTTAVAVVDNNVGDNDVSSLMMDDESSSEFCNASSPPSSRGVDDASDCYSQMTIMTRPSSPTSWGFNDDDVLLPISEEAIDEDAASQDASSFADVSTSFFYDDDMSLGGDNDDYSVYGMDELSPQYDSHHASPTTTAPSSPQREETTSDGNRSAGKRLYNEAFPLATTHDEEDDDDDDDDDASSSISPPTAKRPVAASPNH